MGWWYCGIPGKPETEFSAPTPLAAYNWFRRAFPAVLVMVLLAGCMAKPATIIRVKPVPVPGPVVIERVASRLTEHPASMPEGPPRLVFDVSAQRRVLLAQCWAKLDAIALAHGETPLDTALAAISAGLNPVAGAAHNTPHENE